MKKLIKKLFIFTFILGVSATAVVSVYLYQLYKKLPDPSKIIEEKGFVVGSKIFDRTGKILLYETSQKIRRILVPWEDIPEHLKLAVIAAEDHNFYSHKGISIRGIIRAIVKNIKSGSLTQGGSTISQQFVRNYFLTREKTLKRKIKEILMTYKLEKEYSKDQILYFYLNQIPFGSNVYGVGEAARFYFSKDVKELTLAESAILAAMIKAPTTYSPYGKNPELLKARQEYVLKRMLELGFITKEEYDSAIYQTIKFSKPNIKILAPHFSIYVKELVEDIFGKDFLEKNGVKIITTLDYKLQKKAEELVKEHVEKLGKKLGFSNSALVAIDPKTGEVLALVGSKDFFDIENQGNFNVALQGLRQPGSAIKPLIYAILFEKGFSQDTVVFDVKTDFYSADGKTYSPKNYDLKFRGPVTLKQALAQSLNVPSVKAMYLAGIGTIQKYVEKIGLRDLNVYKAGLSLVLGGGGIRLIDLTNLYATFANDGIKNNLKFILRIEDSEGNVLFEPEKKESRIFSAQSSRLISQILSDDKLRAPMFGENSYLNVKDFKVAAKTGTSQDFRDALTLGYTPTLAVGVWVGNNDNSKMKKGASGLKAAAPLFNKFMEWALKITGTEDFIKPDKINTDKSILNGKFYKEIEIKIDSISKKLATEYTPKETLKILKFKEIHNILYWADKNNPQGPPPLNPEKDPQFESWEKGVIEWAKENLNEPFNNEIPVIEEYDDIHTKENLPKIFINNIEKINDRLYISISLNSKFKLDKVNIFINNNLVKTFYKNEINTSFDVKNYKTPLKIKIEAVDVYFNRAIKEKEI